MQKNILVVTGSPREDGNSDMLANAFIQGAASKGHKINKFNAGRKKLSGCTACELCWTKGTACAILDDFQQLEPLLEEADVIVLAFPLYWYAFPSQIKAAVDRLFAYAVPHRKKKLKIKESVMLVTSGDSSDVVLEGVEKSYELICRHIHWDDRGVISAKRVNAKGEIKNTDYLEEAENLGKKI